MPGVIGTGVLLGASIGSAALTDARFKTVQKYLKERPASRLAAKLKLVALMAEEAVLVGTSLLGAVGSIVFSVTRPAGQGHPVADGIASILVAIPAITSLVVETGNRIAKEKQEFYQQQSCDPSTVVHFKSSRKTLRTPSQY